MRIEEKDNRNVNLHECTRKEAEQYCKVNGREIVEARCNHAGTYFVTMPLFRGKLEEFYRKGGNR